MKKLYLFLTALITVAAVQAQQQILLLAETFENVSNSMVLNTAQVGSNTGTNTWVVNNAYNGQGVYLNTPPQDSIVSGAINAAPNSKYLHIRDAAQPSGAANANWNNAVASDRFVYLGNTFCTLGMTDVKFTFFWICEGDTTGAAYGELYYRADGGAWAQVGQAKYYGQNKWKYEVVQNAAFNNIQNLEFGFRWVNTVSTSASTISFGIDDIIAVGTFENSGPNAAFVGISLVAPSTVCQDNFLTIGYSLNKPLCDGTYRIQLSDATGSFANPFDGGVFNINAPDTSGFIGFQVPDNVQGTCFKVRINRVSPDPQIVGTASVCFTIVDCAESIITQIAPVVTDNDTACILSAIDVMFNSFGVFANNNRYTAQLSDTNGLFTTPYILGQIPSNETFPLLNEPGSVPGLIPQSVPEGCGYYIRIVSSNPVTVGTLYGPFCLTKCDELTNDHTDIKFCVQSGPNPQCDSIKIDPNFWNSNANYDTCNTWTVELRSMMDFSLVNSGGFGVFHDSIGGNFSICMPSTRDLLPVPAGTYYMRIVSSCSDVDWNQTGSVIRMTIGAPSPVASSIETDLGDTVFCNTGLVNFTIVPPFPNSSDAEWSSNILNNGNAFIWPFNPLIVDFTGANTGDFAFYVREINFGCYGPYASRRGITIISTPTVNISGAETICLGDTVTYDVTFLKETYYEWTAPPGVNIFGAGNSQVAMIFDFPGTFTISNFSLNDCGSSTGTYTVNVITPYTIEAGDDQKFACSMDTLKLNAVSNSINKRFETDTNSTQGRQGAMFNIIAHEDVTIDSFAVKILSTQTVQAEIYGKNGSYRTFEQSPSDWNLIDLYNNFPPAPAGRMTVIPIWLNKAIAANDTFAFYITTVNTTPVNMAFANGTGIQQEVVYETDGVIDFVQGTVNNYPFGAFIGPRVLNCRIYYTTKAGLHYLWNTGDTIPSLILYPAQAGQYTVSVYDSSGCKAVDSLMVTVSPSPTVDAGPDVAICPDADYTIPASSNASNIEWQPETGLDNYNVLNPVFNGIDTTKYIITVTDDNGCKNIDSILLWVRQAPTIDAGMDTAICPAIPYQIVATHSGGSILWEPATGLDNSTSATPFFSNNESVNYRVSVTDNFGCVAYDELNMGIVECETYIKIPQAFTPNGDGVNDHFTLFAQYVDDYEIRIFNRWGEMVYQSTDASELNDLGRGWDGTYKGKVQDAGTFVYYVIAKYIDGTSGEKKGNLTLIR